MKKNLFLIICILPFFITNAQQKSIVLSGKITHAKTGEALVGATVLIEDARKGTLTDSTGHFSLQNLSRGHHLLEVSFAGFGSVLEHIDISNDQELNIALTPSVIENQGVVVTGVIASSSRKSPVPVTLIRRTELLQTPATNIIDALAHQAGVSQVSTGPAVSKPVIRGLGFNRVVVVNDGIRQEGQQWGEEHGIEIDEANVYRAEILKGPASLMFGSDALAGVINLITTAPVAEGTIKGNIITNYQTNNRLYTTHAEISGHQKSISWNAYGSTKSAGDYTNRFDGRVFNSRFNEKNYGGYLGLNRHWGYSQLTFSSFNQNLGVIEGAREPVTGRFLVNEGEPDEHVASDKEFGQREVQPPFQEIRHRKVLLDNSINLGKNHVRLTFGYQNNKRKEFANREEDVQQSPELFFDLNTATYTANWVLPEANHWRTTVGLNGMYQHNENRGKEEIIPDYSFNDIGGFIFSQGSFEKYTLSGGIRFDNRSINSKDETENGISKFTAFKKSYSNLSGSAGISYEPNEQVTIKANVGTGFRAPNLAELASNGAHEGTNRWEYGSTNLKSEKSVQGDFEFDMNNEHLTFGLNLFYNRINHFIFYRKLEGINGGDSIVRDDNGELLNAYQFDQNNAKLYGLEASLDLHPHPLDWLHFENKISFVRGEFIQSIFGTNNLPQIPAPRWVTELRVDFKKGGKSLSNAFMMLELDNNFRQQHPFSAYETETETAAYSLLNASAGADILSHKKVLFSIYLAANNLTDKAYQNHLSRLKYTDLNMLTGRRGVFNMGRNFSFKVTIPFSFTTK